LFLAGCGNSRDLVYFNNLPDTAIYQGQAPNVPQPVIQSGDILRIRVNSLNAETNRLFNTGTLQTDPEQSRYSSSDEGNVSAEGYLVNSDGYISFPVVGQVNLAGLTMEQARVHIKGLVE